MKSVLFVVLGIVLLGGLFFIVRPKTVPSLPARAMNKTEIPTSPTEQQHTKDSSFILTISNRKIVGGSSIITVKKGQMVIMHIRSDEDDELHIHGYDKSVELSNNDLATLAFKANTAGRFPFELEKAGVELGAFEIQP